MGVGDAAAATGSGTFFDDDGRPDEVDIEALAARGVTAGCAVDRFCPDAPVKRGEMAVFLQRTLDLPRAGVSWFVDVGAPFDAAADALAAAGIASGCGGSFFCPEAAVTRGQMAIFLARAYNLTDAGAATFSDVAPDNPYAGAISALAGAGITAGCAEESFCPDAAVTRGQMATFLTRANARNPHPAGGGGACPPWIADARVVYDGINAARAAMGLEPVAWVTALDELTTGWAGTLASESDVRHNPAYVDAAFAAVPEAGWVAENVGTASGEGASGAVVDAALTASGPHFSNRVNVDATHVSIGVAWSADATGLAVVEGYAAAEGRPADTPPWVVGC